MRGRARESAGGAVSGTYRESDQATVTAASGRSSGGAGGTPPLSHRGPRRHLGALRQWLYSLGVIRFTLLAGLVLCGLLPLAFGVVEVGAVNIYLLRRHALLPNLLADILMLAAINAAATPIALLSIACHELGHALVFHLLRFRVTAIRIGPYVFARDARGHLRIALQQTSQARWSGSGDTRIIPRSASLLIARYIAGVAAGPIACLALAAACLALGAALLRGLATNPTFFGVVSVAIAAEALAAVALGAVGESIPFTVRGQRSDGAQLWHALRHPANTRRALALVAIWWAIKHGTRSRDWPGAFIGIALDPADDSALHLYALVYAYSWALDRGEVSAAGRYLDEALRRFPAPAKVIPGIGLAFEAAYFVARYRHAVEEARAWLGHDEEGTANVAAVTVLKPRAEAAILLAERRWEAALRQAEEGLAGLARLPASYARINTDSEHEELEAMIADARQHLSPDHPSPG